MLLLLLLLLLPRTSSSFVADHLPRVTSGRDAVMADPSRVTSGREAEDVEEEEEEEGQRSPILRHDCLWGIISILGRKRCISAPTSQRAFFGADQHASGSPSLFLFLFLFLLLLF